MNRMGRSAVIALCAVVAALLATAEGAAATAGGKKARKPSYSNEGIPYKSAPLYLVDGYPLTEEELTRFNQRMLLMSSVESHAKGKPSEVLQSYVRYKVIMDEGKRLGVDKTPRYLAAVGMYRRAALANDFTEHLKSSYNPSEAEMKRILPVEWVQYNFKIIAFKTMEEARAAREKMGDVASIDNVQGDVPLSGYKSQGTTGYLFRKSGFFEEFDEPDLFVLKPGEVSRPVATGVGPAICQALGRKEFSGQEIDSFLAKRVGELKEKYAQEVVKDIRMRAGFRIDDKALNEAVILEGRSGFRGDNVVLFLNDPPMNITYRDARMLAPVNLGPVFRDYPEASWTGFFEGEVRNLAFLHALSMEAEKRGVPLQNRWDKEIYDFRNMVLYQNTISKLYEDTVVEVTDTEMKRYFEEKRSDYVRLPVVRVKYIYTPNEEMLKGFVAQYPEGTSIFEAPEMKTRVKDAVFTSRDKVLGKMFNDIYMIAKGSRTEILSGEAGFYVFLVTEKDPGKQASFEEVKDIVREAAIFEKKNRTINDRVKSLEKKISVTKM